MERTIGKESAVCPAQDTGGSCTEKIWECLDCHQVDILSADVILVQFIFKAIDCSQCEFGCKRDRLCSYKCGEDKSCTAEYVGPPR